MVAAAEAAKWVIKTEENDNRIVIASTDKERTAVDLEFTCTLEEATDILYVNLVISNEPVIEVSSEITQIFMEANENKIISFPASMGLDGTVTNPDVHIFIDNETSEGHIWRLTSEEKPNNVTITASPIAGTTYTLKINPTE